jgi:ribosomal protein S18 acetylase RimI-like enzyme
MHRDGADAPQPEAGARALTLDMTPLVRQAAVSDAPRVADLLIDTRRAFMPYAPSAHTEEDVRAWVSEQLLPGCNVVVAVIDGRVVGTMAMKVRPEVSWISQMAVDPELVGRGIGSSLLAHAMDSLSRPIRLYTFQQNVGARRFYERHGFVAVEFTDGQGNEERCPDVLYELAPTA